MRTNNASDTDHPLKYLLHWLIAGTRGGFTRAQIIQVLKDNTQNANQIAKMLKKDYRTIRHHLDLLQKNRLIDSTGDKYGTSYYLSQQLEENYALFEVMIPELLKTTSVLVEPYPRAFEKLFEESVTVNRDKKISKHTLFDLIRFSLDCAQREEEGRPTSTGFIIGDDKKILKIIPGTVNIVSPNEEISELQDYLRSLFGIVDGMSSAFIVSKKGRLVEVGLLRPLPKTRFDISNLITQRYKTYAYITKTIQDSLAFFSFGKLRVVKLFEGGSLIAEASFSWKEGKWVFRSYRIAVEKLAKLAKETEINFEALCKCLSLAIEMSNRRLGGSFIIGDHKTVLSQSEKPLFHFGKTNILDFGEEKEDYMINLASKEFSTILDSNGMIMGSSTRLLARVPAAIPIEVTREDGGRHRSAAEMSAVAIKSVALVISQDGPITIYSKGKRIMRI